MYTDHWGTYSWPNAWTGQTEIYLLILAMQLVGLFGAFGLWCVVDLGKVFRHGCQCTIPVWDFVLHFFWELCISIQTKQWNVRESPVGIEFNNPIVAHIQKKNNISNITLVKLFKEHHKQKSYMTYYSKKSFVCQISSMYENSWLEWGTS